MNNVFKSVNVKKREPKMLKKKMKNSETKKKYILRTTTTTNNNIFNTHTQVQIHMRNPSCTCQIWCILIRTPSSSSFSLFFLNAWPEVLRAESRGTR